MLGQLFYRITADTGPLNKNLSQAQKSMSSADKTMSQTSKKISGHSRQAGASIKEDVSGVDKSFGGLNKSIVNVGKALIGAFAARAVFNSIKNLVTGLSEKADRLLDLQDITGITTEKLQEYEYVAKIAGVTTEALANASQGLTQRLARATGESSPLNLALTQLGIAARDTFGELRSGSDILDDAIGQLAEMENVTERNVLGQQVFGGAWRDMAPILAMGAEGIKEVREEAHSLGIVMSEDALKGANDLRQATVRLNAQKQVLSQTIGMMLIPALESGATKMNEWLNVMKTPTDVSSWEKIARIAGSLGGYIATGFGQLPGGDFFRGLLDPIKFKAWAAQSVDAGKEINKVLDALKGINDEEKLRTKLAGEAIRYQNMMRDYQDMLTAEKEKGNNADKLKIAILEAQMKMAEEVAGALTKNQDDYIKGLQQTQKEERNQEDLRLEALGDIGRIQEQIGEAQKQYTQANSTAERVAASIRINELNTELDMLHNIARARAAASGIDLRSEQMPSIPGTIKQTLDIDTTRRDSTGGEDMFWIQFQKDYQDALEKTITMHGALGDSYDLIGNKIHETEGYIGQLIANGYTLQDEELVKMIQRLEELRNAQDEVKDSAMDWAMMAGGAIAGLANEIGAMAAGAETSFHSLMSSMINSIGQIINALFAKAVAGLFSTEVSSKGVIGLGIAAAGVGALKAMWASNVPALAEGGIARGETLALVGEYAGASTNPEVISPLSDLTALIQGSLNDVGGTILNYNIEIPSVPETLDVPVTSTPKESVYPKEFKARIVDGGRDLYVIMSESLRQHESRF